MSSDMPDLVKIRQQSANLAIVWWLGDILYYVGVLGIVGLLIAGAFINVSELSTVERVLFWSVAAVVISSIIAGPSLKRVARRRAGIK